MDVGRTEGVQGPGRIEGKPFQPVKPAETEPLAPSDRLDISETGCLASQAILMQSTRLDRIAELKAQIDAGTYQTDEKLVKAFEGFLSENPDVR
jgi:anti-sigma28 factor (negative regulator of flagellin synthesis)